MHIICSIIKNERRHLEEWIAWHLALGFNAIYLYEDFGSVSHKDITSKYPNVFLLSPLKLGIKPSHKRLGENYQRLVYERFAHTHKGWCAFIDADEFIMIEKGYSLDKLTKELSNQYCIALFWKNFNANGHTTAQKSLLKSFTTECDMSIGNYPFKSLCRLEKVGKVESPHHIMNKFVTTDGKKALAYPNMTPVYDKCWINHYYTQSLEEWREKILTRGDLSKGNRRISEFFKYNPDINLGKLL